MVRVTRKARFFEKDRIELGREDAIRHLRGRSEGDLEMFWSLCVFWRRVILLKRERLSSGVGRYSVTINE